VAHNIFSITHHSGGVEESVSLGRVVIRWRQSKSPGRTLLEEVVIR